VAVVKVLSVVGARPQFVKLAPIAERLSISGDQHLIVHTGQHYDVSMSDVFFEDLAIPEPDVHLGVGSGSHGVQTGGMLAALDGVLDEHRPDVVLVYGDTNSTLAGAVAAVKMHLPVAHLEAGLRSFNRRMPEEHNRVLTDHASDLLLAPTEQAVRHLAAEGLASRVRLTGDVMADVCFRVRDRVREELPPFTEWRLPAEPYLVATLHRAENTDDPARLRKLLDALDELPMPVVLLAHPRLVARRHDFGITTSESVRWHPPLPYPQMVAAVLGSEGVVTDSGGLQKEAFLLERRCITLRSETEWPETLVGGWNVLAPDGERLDELVRRPAPDPEGQHRPYGDGDAAARVVDALTTFLHDR